jgi:outer membrane phospholipase A
MRRRRVRCRCRGPAGAQATYPLSKLWRPLNFYALVDYWTGYGETILRYDLEGSGFALGISVSR